MFDELFERPHALARQRNGPLADQRRRYLRYLADQGATRTTLKTVAHYILGVCHYLALDRRADERIHLAEIEEKAALWGKRPQPSPRRTPRCPARAHARFRWHATQWLTFLGRLHIPPVASSPYAEVLGEFADFMRLEQGLSPATIKYRCLDVEDFLDRLGLDGDLRQVSITILDEVLLKRVQDGGYARSTVQTYATTLRAFFRYAEGRGWCRVGLATGIQAPRVFPQERLPIGPTWSDVQRLIATTDTGRPIDIRDRAIILLLAVYGLRAGEVVRLRLDDLDWERELILVRRAETREAPRYPLTPVVGEAILHYLRSARPRCGHREVFLTRRAPWRPLRGGLWRIVSQRLRSLDVPLPHHGPHMLRHACASHLLQRGLTLKEIGDHLGHRSPDTTRIYAKVDLAGLRQVAAFDLGEL